MGIESKPALRAGLTTFRKLCSSTSKAAYMLDIDTSEVSDVEPAPAVTTFPTVFSARDTRPEMGATIRVCPQAQLSRFKQIRKRDVQGKSGRERQDPDVRGRINKKNNTECHTENMLTRATYNKTKHTQ